MFALFAPFPLLNPLFHLVFPVTGTCLPVFGKKEGEICYRDTDCETGKGEQGEKEAAGAESGGGDGAGGVRFPLRLPLHGGVQWEDGVSAPGPWGWKVW